MRLTRAVRRAGGVVACLAAAAMLMSACTSPGSADSGDSGATTQGAGPSGAVPAPAKSGGHLTVALAEAPDVLDPTKAQTFVGTIVMHNFCESLYDIDSDLKLVPDLASAMPVISDGGKTYTIKLRSGITFNDGTPFDAAAVKRTIERNWKDPKSSRTSDLAKLTSVAVVDPTTIKLTLSAPYAPFTGVLAGRAGMIQSPKQIDKLGDKFGQHPVCVGPFTFVSRPSADEINLAKSTYYYDKSKVKLDKVTFKVVTQPNVRASNLRSGDVDIAERLDPTQVKSLKGASNIKLDQVVSLGYQGLQINIDNSNGANTPPYKTVDTPLAKNPELRKAFVMTLDRDAINKVVFNGLYLPGCTPIPPNSPYYPDITCPKANVAKAKQIVEDSGVKTPIKVTLMVRAANDQATKLGEVIQSMAKPAGFDVSVKPLEFTTEISQARAGKFDAVQLGWSGGIDPDNNIRPFWVPGPLNFTGAHDQKIIDLVNQASQTTDMAKRKAMYKQLIETFWQQNNVVYLYHIKYITGLSKKVHDVGYYSDGLIRLKTAYLS